MLQEIDFKGQMIFLQESDTMMFLGSPSVEKLDEMIGKGIYISDIPIHDATRDVILVGEQTKAQVYTALCRCIYSVIQVYIQRYTALCR